MKAGVSKADLLSHRGHLKIVKLSKKLLERAQVTLTVSNTFSVTGPGFRHDLPCDPEEWGTVSLPYRLWENLILKVLPIVEEEKLTISADTFVLKFGKTKIDNPQIKVRGPDRLSIEIASDATPLELVHYALRSDLRTLRGSVIWATIRAAFDEIRRHVERASIPLKRYGISAEDLAHVVALRVGIKDTEKFISILFSGC
jgi:hypothetical protein